MVIADPATTMRNPRTPGTGAATSRARRRDSLENADKVMNAALLVCSERGLSVTLPEVAARAGVGRATVYRSFGSRDDLIQKIMQVKLHALRHLIADLSQGQDAWAAINRVLDATMSTVRTDRLLADALVLRPELLKAQETSSHTLAGLLARAREQGSVRPDVTEADVRLLVSGLAHSLTVGEESTPTVWERAAKLVAHAIKADS